MQKLFAWWAVLGMGTVAAVATLVATQWLAWNGPEWIAVERRTDGPIETGAGLIIACGVAIGAIFVGTIGGLAAVAREDDKTNRR